MKIKMTVRMQALFDHTMVHGTDCWSHPAVAKLIKKLTTQQVFAVAESVAVRVAGRGTAPVVEPAAVDVLAILTEMRAELGQ